MSIHVLCLAGWQLNVCNNALTYVAVKENTNIVLVLDFQVSEWTLYKRNVIWVLYDAM